MVPWRATAPVRARIASSSVVLPLWNGPTSATQRGLLARVPLPPFVAIDHLRSGLLPPARKLWGQAIVSGSARLGQGARHCARLSAQPRLLPPPPAVPSDGISLRLTERDAIPID